MNKKYNTFLFRLDCFARPANSGNGARNDETTLVPSKRAAFTKPSRGTSDSGRRTIINENRAFRFDCERCRLMRGAAFTLAEVLITLGIIGVVAAITIFTLVKNYQATVWQNQFKQAYADLNNASKMFQVHNDMSVSEKAASSSVTRAATLFKKEFNTVLKTSNLSWRTEDEEGFIDAVPYTYYSMDKKRRFKYTACDIGIWFWDVKGRLIGFDDAPTVGYNGPKVCIDINGEKAPNRFGVDFFVFVFTMDGYVIPYGQEHKNNNTTVGNMAAYLVVSPIVDYCKYGNDGRNGTITCANFALINKHPSDDNKDYWHDFINGR